MSVGVVCAVWDGGGGGVKGVQNNHVVFAWNTVDCLRIYDASNAISSILLHFSTYTVQQIQTANELSK